MTEDMNIHLLGIPMDLGQTRRGVDMGPSALRYAGLADALRSLGHTVHDRGDLVVPNPEDPIAAAGTTRVQAVARVCQSIYEQGRAAVEEGAFPLFLGGDHSLSIGSVKAVAHNNPETLGVIWVDAHADFNTPESSPSGNLHGMPMAVLTGDGPTLLVNVGDQVTIPERNIVQIGVRDIDAAEGKRIRGSALNVLTMREIDEQGMANAVMQALQKLEHCDRIHVSLDLDALDPSNAPGVGTPVRGGLTYREAHLLSEILAECNKVSSLDVVEINPILDQQNLTAELAVELIASLLGKKIV